MKLFIDGRDIHGLFLADMEAGEGKYYEGEPETFLRSLDAFLQSCGKTIANVEELHMMVGEGSATALRSSLAIANTLMFTRQVRVFAYQSKENTETVFTSVQDGTLVGDESQGYLAPVYSHGPRITASKKDQLNRRQS